MWDYWGLKNRYLVGLAMKISLNQILIKPCKNIVYGCVPDGAISCQ